MCNVVFRARKVPGKKSANGKGKAMTAIKILHLNLGLDHTLSETYHREPNDVSSRLDHCVLVISGLADLTETASRKEEIIREGERK